MTDKRWVYIGFVLVQTVIFGFGSAVTKIAYESVTPLWCLAIRFGMAFAVFALFFGPRIVAQVRAARIRAWLPAALCMAVSYIACNVALDMTSATNVGFLIALPVVFTPFIAAAVLGRKYKLVHAPFQVAAVIGLYLLCCNGGGFSFGWGEALALLAAIALAGALVFGERGLKSLDIVTMSATQVGATFLLSLAGALAFEPAIDVAAVGMSAWAVVVFLALFSTCLTFALQNAALTRLTSTTVSMLLCGEPLFTALFSWMILGETLDGVGLVGAAVIVACVLGETYFDGRSAGQGVAHRPRARRLGLHPAPAVSAGETCGAKQGGAARP